MKIQNYRLDLTNFSLLLLTHIETSYAPDSIDSRIEAIADFFEEVTPKYLEHIANQVMVDKFNKQLHTEFKKKNYKKVRETPGFLLVYKLCAEIYFSIDIDECIEAAVDQNLMETIMLIEKQRMKAISKK